MVGLAVYRRTEAGVVGLFQRHAGGGDLGRRAGGRPRARTDLHVEPTGEAFDDSNVTDRKLPGNPPRSYRSCAPSRVTGEVTEWRGHERERLQQMKDHVARLQAQGVEAID